MLPNPDQNGSIQSFITSLDELEGINPELAATIRQQEEQQIRVLNEALKEMPPEEMIKRLKGVLWRLVPLLRLSEMVRLDFGSEVLSVSLRTALVTITDAVKWIGWNNNLDPLDGFGDDTTIVALRDMMLGQDPSGMKHEGSDLDAGSSPVHNYDDDPEI